MKPSSVLIGLFAALHSFRPLDSWASARPGAEQASVRRFSLAIGSSFGGPLRDTLLYTASDARAFGKVLGEMGGVADGDTKVIANPTPAQLDQALEELRRKVIAAQSHPGRTEVIVYYSGHADDKGLLLGDKGFEYDRFRREIDSIPAHVRIAVLDACASGAITRLKGGRRRPAFTVDASSDMRGYAFITSSSPEEASQESDQIGSSFFTHYLVSGLRGAADVSGDGKVTLGEAYQFAFHETLERTERTKGGPQHPAYDMKLSGTGDVVMTDMRETTAGLVLDKQLEGRFFVRTPSGQLIAELYKPQGRLVELGLPPGTYSIRIEQAKALASASIALSEGKRTLAAADFQPFSKDLAWQRGKGGIGVPRGADTDSGRGFGMEINDHVDLGFRGGMDRRYTLSLGFLLNRQPQPFHGLQLALFFTHAATLWGGQISVFGNSVGGPMEGFQISAIGNVATDSTHGLQLAPITNIAKGSVTGGQGAAVLNVAGALRGGQGAGVGNVAWGFVNGGQAAAVFNAAKGVQGGQVAAVANVSLGNVKGGQVSAVLNAARDVKGGQVTAVANAARDVEGAQVAAVLNAARDVNGSQVGLVNISHDIRNGIPFGLINYSHTGLHSANLWADELGFQHVELLSGSRTFYTYLSAGDRVVASGKALALGAGLGVQVPRGRWFGAADLGVTDFHFNYDFDGNGPALYRLRLRAGRELIPFVSVFGGLSGNVFWDRGDGTAFPAGEYQAKLASDVYAWPGFYLGLRLGR
ncbi:MAG TPA: caspase family protein [Fibrobacteria bacterium]|nr:caspase family protein [Fibrobacteria bacterium]